MSDVESTPFEDAPPQVPSVADRAVPCPQCRYDLRAAECGRCPECGLPFDLAALATGEIRRNIPTAMDRADPWTIHEVLLAGLRDLWSANFRKNWLFRAISTDGPAQSGMLVIVVSLIMSFICATLVFGIFTYLPGVASPAVAIRNGLFVWAPRAVASGFLLAFLCALPILTMRIYGHPDATIHARLRLASYYFAAQGGFITVFWAGSQAMLPSMPRWQQSAWLLFAVTLSGFVLLRESRGRATRGSTLAILVSHALAMAICGPLMSRYRADFTPPPWIF